MSKNEISNIMARQHILIDKLLNAFLYDVKAKSKRMNASFVRFSWVTKKHFFIEEQAIISCLPWKRHSVADQLRRLEGEHAEMMAVIEGMGNNLSKVPQKEIKSLNEFLGVHRDMEEKEVYPVLDEKLTSRQKQQIIIRINQISIK